MTRPIAPSVLALALALPLACDKKDEPKDSSEAAATPSTPAESSRRASVASLPAIELPGAVPETAAGVLVVRTPESLFATMAGFDLFGEPGKDDTEAMRKELDAYLEQRIGMTLTEVDRVTVFLDGDKGVAAIIEGADGTPKGRSVGEHEGVPLLALGKASSEDALVAKHDTLLIVGQPEAVKRALSAAAGKAKSLKDAGGPLAELLTADSKGVALAAAVQVDRLPKDLRGPVEKLGVQQATLQYGAKGVRAVAKGSKESMEALLGQMKIGMDMLVAKAEQTKTEALAGDDTMMGVASIFGHHSAKQLRGRLEPKLDGDELSVEIPVQIQDPMMLTAVAGIAAAIAIPAFTKYMRRSKTSESRVQIAKMFDAASSYFNEEHITSGSVAIIGAGGTISPIAPHQCPNDGRTLGNAGPTPPLSVNCNEGPGGLCVPVAGEPSGPGEYSMKLWTDNPVWSAMNFQQEQGHRFHYDFRWQNDPTGFGTCQFTAQAFGDLDDDGVFSTFERSGAADEMGVNAAAGLYIDQEVE